MDFWVSRYHFDRFATDKLGLAAAAGAGLAPPMFGNSLSPRPLPALIWNDPPTSRPVPG